MRHYWKIVDPIFFENNLDSNRYSVLLEIISCLIRKFSIEIVPRYMVPIRWMSTYKSCPCNTKHYVSEQIDRQI